MNEITFDREGTELFAMETGQGDALVFLHGGLADHRSTLLRLGSLAASHRVIAPDVRASGRSIFAGALSWDLLADDVAALLDHLRIARAVIGGASMGSAIATRFALRYPHRLRGLVLVMPAFAGRDLAPSLAQREAFALMDAHAQRAVIEGIEAMRPLYERVPPPMRERAIGMMRSFDPASVAATTRLLVSGAQPFEHAVELAAIDAPAIVVPGTDPEHPAEVATIYAEHLRNATLADPMQDLAVLVGDFCRSLPKGTVEVH